MEIMAPAKLNLYLEVFGKRLDGYHEIGTLFEKISIFDRIFLEISNFPTKITAKGENIPTGEGSLLWNTIKTFKSVSGKDLDFTVDVKKNIPVAAGMGGGSSDAASLLRGLNEITGKNLSEKQLEDIAGALGSDVTFFLKNTSFALGTGRGEIIKEVSTKMKLGHIIVNPPFKVSTKEVYGKHPGFALTKNKAWATMLTLFLNKNGVEDLLEYLRNDLQQIVLRESPAIGEIISFLRRVGAKQAMMTGSGPTVFGIFDAETMPKALIKVKEHFTREKGWRVYDAFTV